MIWGDRHYIINNIKAIRYIEIPDNFRSGVEVSTLMWRPLLMADPLMFFGTYGKISSCGWVGGMRCTIKSCHVGILGTCVLLPYNNHCFCCSGWVVGGPFVNFFASRVFEGDSHLLHQLCCSSQGEVDAIVDEVPIFRFSIRQGENTVYSNKVTFALICKVLELCVWCFHASCCFLCVDSRWQLTYCNWCCKFFCHFDSPS